MVIPLLKRHIWPFTQGCLVPQSVLFFLVRQFSHSLAKTGQTITECRQHTVPPFPPNNLRGKLMDHRLGRMSHCLAEHQLKRSISFTVKYSNHPWKINCSYFCLLNKVKANLLCPNLV